MYRLKDVLSRFRIGLFALVLTAVALASCKSQKPFVPAVTDSVTTISKSVERDTMIKAPAAAASFSVSMDKLLGAVKIDYSNSHALADQSYKLPGVKPPHSLAVPIGTATGKQATATASIQNGELQVTCQCDSMAIAAKLLDKYLQTDRTRTITLPPVETKYIPWYVNALAWFGGLSAAFFSVMLYRVVKRKISG